MSQFHVSTRKSTNRGLNFIFRLGIDLLRSQCHVSTPWNQPIDVSVSCLEIRNQPVKASISCLQMQNRPISVSISCLETRNQPGWGLNFMSLDSVSTSWCLNFMSWFRVDRLMSQFHVSTRNRHVTNTLCGRACGSQSQNPDLDREAKR